MSVSKQKELPIVAIVYDFDGTLSPGSMQEHSFIPDMGYSDVNNFWAEVLTENRKRDGDSVLTYMQLMVNRSKRPVTRQNLKEHGAMLPLFDGLTTWFERTNTYAQKRGIALEHFVVSSGIREMIEGCKIFSVFKNVYASSFVYNEEGHAVWPAVAINYTTTMQFLFRINKGIDNTWDNDEINKWQPMNERRVPFDHMIFLGDGDTDIPAMKMVREKGGAAIAVFNPKEWGQAASQNKIHRLISEDRASYVAPADYSEGSQLDVTVRGVLGRLARVNGYRPI